MVTVTVTALHLEVLMNTVTVNQIMTMRPCSGYPRSRVVELWVDREAVYRVLKVFMDTMHAMKAGPYAERCAERPWGPLPDPRAAQERAEARAEYARLEHLKTALAILTGRYDARLDGFGAAQEVIARALEARRMEVGEGEGVRLAENASHVGHGAPPREE